MLATKNSRLSANPFSTVPALGNLPSIKRAEASVPNELEPSRKGRADGICLVTKTAKYTHRLLRWISINEDEDTSVVEEFIKGLRLGFSHSFSLDHPANLTYPITASRPTVGSLIDIVRSNNDFRQAAMDMKGRTSERALNFSHHAFMRPELELVALHPEHFIPAGNLLTVYDPITATHKHYVAAADGYLRESADPSSPRLPPFRSPTSSHCSTYLIILNAESQFRRYLQMDLPSASLPDEVLNLMKLTIELADLLYWKPIPTKGLKGEKLRTEVLASL